MGSGDGGIWACVRTHRRQPGAVRPLLRNRIDRFVCLEIRHCCIAQTPLLCTSIVTLIDIMQIWRIFRHCPPTTTAFLIIARYSRLLWRKELMTRNNLARLSSSDYIPISSPCYVKRLKLLPSSIITTVEALICCNIFINARLSSLFCWEENREYTARQIQKITASCFRHLRFSIKKQTVNTCES